MRDLGNEAMTLPQFRGSLPPNLFHNTRKSKRNTMWQLTPFTLLPLNLHKHENPSVFWFSQRVWKCIQCCVESELQIACEGKQHLFILCVQSIKC